MIQAWTNYAPDADQVHLGAQNLWDVPDFSGTQFLPCKKEKNITFTNLQSNNVKKVVVNSEYYHKHQHTCNILLRFATHKGGRDSWVHL